MRSDADNLKALEKIKPVFDKLNADRIRAEADMARHAADYEKARADAMRELGVCEEAEIRELISARRRANTEAVDRFVQAVQAVQAKLATLEGDGK